MKVNDKASGGSFYLQSKVSHRVFAVTNDCQYHLVVDMAVVLHDAFRGLGPWRNSGVAISFYHSPPFFQ